MTDPVMIQKEANYVKEVVLGLQRRKDATSFIRDVVEAAKADGFNPKQIRKLAKLAMEQNAAEVKEEVEELFDKDETLGL